MIGIESQDGVVVARLSGDIDMANTGAIEDAVGRSVTSEARGFVLEMTDVTYLDSAGVRLMYRLDERASGRQQSLVVVVPPGALINRTLEAAGALGSLRIVASVDEAVDLLTR